MLLYQLCGVTPDLLYEISYFAIAPELNKWITIHDK